MDGKRERASVVKVTFGGAGVSIGRTARDFEMVFKLFCG
jgi:hypothetical protein